MRDLIVVITAALTLTSLGVSGAPNEQRDRYGRTLARQAEDACASLATAAQTSSGEAQYLQYVAECARADPYFCEGARRALIKENKPVPTGLDCPPR